MSKEDDKPNVDKYPPLPPLEFYTQGIDWWKYLVTNPTRASTQDITLESVLKIKEELEALPKPEFNCIVVVAELWQKLRSKLPEGGPPDIIYNRMYGIPVYTAADDYDAKAIYLKLVEEGKRPALITE